MNFAEVLTQAWNIIWKNKILWLFGFFASLGAGGSMNSGNFNYNFGENDFPNWTENLPPWFNQLQETAIIWVPVVILLTLLFIVILSILNTIGRIGLANGGWLADRPAVPGEEYPTLKFNTLWQTSKRYFWRVLLLTVMLGVLALTLGLIVLIPTIGLSVLTLGIGLICLLPLLCVLFVAFGVLVLIANMAVIGIVNEDRNITDSVSHAWMLFKSRPVDIIVIAFILWIMSWVAGFIVGLPTLLILAPVFGGLLSQSEAMLQGSMLLSGILLLLYLPVLLFAQSIIQSYNGVAWTLVYRRISSLLITAQSTPSEADRVV